jgi:hypothetical protein
LPKEGNLWLSFDTSENILALLSKKEQPMTALAKLKLVSVQAGLKSPIVIRRNKPTGHLTHQIALAKAANAGDVFTAKKVKFLTDTATGERTSVEVSTRVKPWWFSANGKIALTLRYGAKVLEIAKGKNAIEVEDMDDLIATLEIIKDAAHAGELDAQIDSASNSLRAGFGKKKAASK